MRSWLRLLLAWACVLWSTLGWCEAPAVVSVQVVGALGRDSVLRQRIASWFESDNLQVVVEPAARLDTRSVLAPQHGAIVKVWITRRSEKLARLYFATNGSETGQARYLIRDLELERGLDEVAAEELAQSVHLSALALLEGQIESSREEVQRSLESERDVAPPPTSVEPEKSASAPLSATSASGPAAPSVQLFPALGYAVELRGGEGTGHGPRGRLQLSLQSGWGLWGRLYVMLPHTEALSALSLELSGGSLLFAPSYRRSLTPSVSLGAYGGMSLELVQYRASPVPGVEFAPAPASSELRPRAVVGFLAGFGRWPRLGVVGELGWALHASDYESARGDTRRVVARAARLVPALGLELEF